MPQTSIIIRTKNEEKWISECLKRLREQTYQDFEIIVVDSGSTDRTLEMVRQFDVRLFQIRPEEFSYPFALNYGCRQAYASEYFVFLSAHSLPSSRTWLEDGIRNFSDTIMGIYGFVWALPDGSIGEKIIFNEWLCRVRSMFRKKMVIREVQMGVLGFTNTIIRRDLWEQHHFDERYGLGGEDGEWARFWFARGYYAIRTIDFSVYHSHGLGFKALLKQWRYWKSLDNPQPFKFPEFRGS